MIGLTILFATLATLGGMVSIIGIVFDFERLCDIGVRAATILGTLAIVSFLISLFTL